MTVRLTMKMMEAIMFMIDDRASMIDRLADRWSHRDVLHAIDRLYDPVESDRMLPENLTPCEKDVLKTVIESSDWVTAYVTEGPSEAHLEEARATLRDLARLVEPLGIEVSRIAYE